MENSEEIKFVDSKNKNKYAAEEEKRKQPAKGVIKADTEKFRASLYINKEMYEEFTAINKKRGLTNNSVTNMLIGNYIKENGGIL